jgi:CheY-like chemotaxis protein
MSHAPLAARTSPEALAGATRPDPVGAGPGLSAEMRSRMDRTVRTPMTAILGFADLLEADLPEGAQGAELREAVRTIKRNGRHLMEIMGTILDISGIEAGRVTPGVAETDTVALCLSVLDAVRDQAASKSLGLRGVFHGAVPSTIRTDAGRLTRLLTTLASNAVRFTDSGGVELRVWTHAGPDGEEVRFDVIDSGIGMTAEQAAHLANPGAVAPASEQAPVGLGLHLCHAYAALLGGRIEVRSQLGAGSRVGLALPADALRCGPGTVETTALEPTAGPAGGPGEFLPLAGARVLLVEDGLDNQVLLRLLLRRAGADVELAADGLEALAHADHANHDFDLVLMDMHMPNLDGYRATAQLRDRGCTLPIIALTAMAMAGDRERCLRSGCDDYLSKPIDRGLLVETCKRWMLGDLVRA